MASSVFIFVIGIFALGVVAGIVAVVSLGSRREDRGPFLREDGPDNLTRGARRLTGLYVRREHPYHTGSESPFSLGLDEGRTDQDLLV